MSEVGPSATDMGMPPAEAPRTAEPVTPAKKKEELSIPKLCAGLLMIVTKDTFMPVLEDVTNMSKPQGH